MSAPTDTSHRDLMDRDKGLTPTPTARELLTLLGMEDTVETLAARVEAVLTLAESPCPLLGDGVDLGWDAAMARVLGRLNSGRQQGETPCPDYTAPAEEPKP